MKLRRNRLYSILLIASSTGFIWLCYSISKNWAKSNMTEVCLIKHFTNIPCPSCGATRSVLSLIKGDFLTALAINPIGYIIAVIMLITPIWISVDLLTGNQTLFISYQKMEARLRKPKYAFPLILIMIVNWIWNITKGL